MDGRKWTREVHTGKNSFKKERVDHEKLKRDILEGVNEAKDEMGKKVGFKCVILSYQVCLTLVDVKIHERTQQCYQGADCALLVIRELRVEKCGNMQQD